MKASFFIHLAFAILFGLAAGLPQYARNALEPRAYVTTTEVVVVTRPAVIVHVHGTRTTWTETFAAVPTVPTVNPEPESTSIPTSTEAGKSSSSTVRDLPSPEPEVPSTSKSTLPLSTRTRSVVSHSNTRSSSELNTESPTTTSALLTAVPNSLSSCAYSATASSSASSTPPTPSADSADGFGIGYNPYNADSSCKDSAAISSDISALQGYGMIRLYGTDCQQLDTVLPTVHKEFPKMKLFLGIWHCETTDAALREANAIIKAVNKHLGGDWSSIDTVSVGNEVIDRGEASVDSLLGTLKAVQKKFRPYGVPVVTVETPGVFKDAGKALCQASDYTAINAHPFFDKSGAWTDPRRAGEFTKTMADVAGCGKQRTVITESGWPHGSDLGQDYFIKNNLPVPSPQNHAAAIESLKKAYAGHKQDLIVFSAYDDLWKLDTALTMGVEHYWGILN